jgi:hypothetical protein
MAVALGIIGPLISGVMGFAQASYQAKIADMNADIAKDNAGRAVFRSQVEQQDQDVQTAQMLGTQEAAQSASGISLNSESSRRIRKASRMLGRKDALNVRQAGEIEKYNYLVEAANQTAQGQMAKLGGIGSLLSGFIGAGSSLLGSASSTTSSFAPLPYMKPKILT